MENCEQAVFLGLSILFLYATTHKILFFEKLFMS